MRRGFFFFRFLPGVLLTAFLAYFLDDHFK
jgi:hypothetical protein